MKRILTLLFCLLASHILFAQEPTGTWYGSLDIQGNPLNLIFHLSKNAEGYRSTMDSPLQNVMGIPMAKTTYIDHILIVEAPDLGIKYRATFLPDQGQINGTFEQGGLRLPLILNSKAEKTAIAAPLVRAQDPKDFPYQQEEVTFSNKKAGHTLTGTLTMPADGKASKIVVLITGSGAQNRNEEMFNHRPFLVLSDWLTRHGIAVLRYDDRGIGKSTGNFATATTADFADDVEAALNYINNRADLKNLSIGLIGHSEGGMIAPMVASRNKAVKFIVLMAGPGVPINELMVKQNKDGMKLKGAPDDAISTSEHLNTILYAALIQYQNLPTSIYNQKMDSVANQLIGTPPGSASNEKVSDEVIATISNSLKLPWTKYFITFTPSTYLAKLKCPVLAINGTLDFQVSASSNLSAIQATLQKAGNKQFEIVPFEGLNHLFQKATTGSADEYGKIEETLNPAVLEKITSWIKGI